MALTTRPRKKAPATRRKLIGAAAAPVTSYRAFKDYFHFDVDRKEHVAIIKSYVKKTFDKVTASTILKNKEYHFYKSHVASYCYWVSNGKPMDQNTIDWMTGYFDDLVERGKLVVEEKEVSTNVVSIIPSIQDRIREASNNIICELDEVVDEWIKDPKSFKGVDAIKLMRKLNVNQAHARNIRSYYEPQMNELTELSNLPTTNQRKKLTEQEEDMIVQLEEGYAHLDKTDINKAVALFKGIISACDLITAESKAVRKTRAPKPKSVDKLVSKLKYCVSDEKYKVASINPVDIIDATELWVFNIKTRKIGKYVAQERQTLQVKGTTLQWFDDATSVSKTLRKPELQLQEFLKTGKVQLRKYLDTINGVETKLNGRIGLDTIILKATK